MTQITLKTHQQIEFLKCFYTPEERAELSERLCRAIALKAEKEEEFAVVKADFGEAIKAQELEIKRLSRRLNFGYEHKNVACDVVLNSPAVGKKTILRTDVPGEIVRVLEMDSDEQIEAPPVSDKLFETAPEQVSADSQRVSDTPAMGSRTSIPVTDGDPQGETQPRSAESLISSVLQHVCDDVNSGALDSTSVKATARVAPVEASVEERARTRATKRRQKLQGEAALLPDKRTGFPHGANEVQS